MRLMGVLGVYLALLLFVSWHHELWRDETRAFSLMVNNPGIGELLLALRTEGHPPLWYLILRLGYGVFASPLVLQGASILIALLMVFTFLRFAPFSFLEKIIFTFGFYPAYEYSVMCRNYGLGVLLIFVICALDGKRYSQPLLRGVLLFLLSQSSIYGTIITCAFIGADFFDLFFNKTKSEFKLKIRFFIAYSIAVLGPLLCVMLLLPGKGSLVTDGTFTLAKSPSSALIRGILSQGSFAHNAFGVPFFWFVPCVLVLLYFWLLPFPSLIIFLFSSILGFELIDRLVYSAAALRHQGFVFICVIATVWLARLRDLESNPVCNLERYLFIRPEWFKKMIPLGILLILLLQLKPAAEHIINDIRYPISASLSLGNKIRENNFLKDAIIISEPDSFLDSIAYYTNNRIYLAREETFRDYVLFISKKLRKSFSLAELNQTAKILHETYNVPIIIVLGHDISKPWVRSFSYGKTFDIKSIDIENFHNECELFFKLDNPGVAHKDEYYSAFIYPKKKF